MSHKLIKELLNLIWGVENGKRRKWETFQSKQWKLRSYIIPGASAISIYTTRYALFIEMVHFKNVFTLYFLFKLKANMNHFVYHTNVWA